MKSKRKNCWLIIAMIMVQFWYQIKVSLAFPKFFKYHSQQALLCSGKMTYHCLPHPSQYNISRKRSNFHTRRDLDWLNQLGFCVHLLGSHHAEALLWAEDRSHGCIHLRNEEGVVPVRELEDWEEDKSKPIMYRKPHRNLSLPLVLFQRRVHTQTWGSLWCWESKAGIK